MHAAVERLSLKLRNAVVMHYCLHLPASEAAARQGCAPGTVSARLVEARRQLWGQLDTCGTSEAAAPGKPQGGVR
jgi:DNA-directed RNA polymerase specialized sigma24 family protein